MKELFIPLGDTVVLRQLKKSERTTTNGLIYVPDAVADMRYVVVGAGPGRRSLLRGELVPNVVEKGWVVVLSGEPQPMQVPGKSLFFAGEADCLVCVGKIEE